MKRIQKTITIHSELWNIPLFGKKEDNSVCLVSSKKGKGKFMMPYKALPVEKKKTLLVAGGSLMQQRHNTQDLKT